MAAVLLILCIIPLLASAEAISDTNSLFSTCLQIKEEMSLSLIGLDMQASRILLHISGGVTSGNNLTNLLSFFVDDNPAVLSAGTY